MKTLICKKDLIGDRTYRVGKEYEVYIEDSNTGFFILTDEFAKDSHTIKGLWFSNNVNNLYAKDINDYFYFTNQELRKAKLLKLTIKDEIYQNEIPNL